MRTWFFTLGALAWAAPSQAVDAGTARLGEFYPVSQAEDPVVAEVARAVVRFSGATGVVVHEEGYILTNHHVRRSFGERGTVRLAVTDTSGGRALTVELVDDDAARDVALYRVTGGAPGPLPAVDLRATPAKVGEAVFVVGHPDGAPQRVSFGKVLARDLVISGRPSIEYSAQTWWGSSGSPVFDAQGRMVALHWGWDADGTSNGRLTGVPVAEVLDALPALADLLAPASLPPAASSPAEPPRIADRCTDPRAWGVRSRAAARAVAANAEGRSLDRVRVSLVAADPGCAAAVHTVTWTLHPTFKNPVVAGQGDDFGVTLHTWGRFDAGLHIVLRDGRAVRTAGLVAW
jgi:S1-C subfamily serine protease